MPHVMKYYKPAHPLDIGVLGANTVMPGSDGVSHAPGQVVLTLV